MRIGTVRRTLGSALVFLGVLAGLAVGIGVFVLGILGIMHGATASPLNGIYLAWGIVCVLTASLCGWLTLAAFGTIGKLLIDSGTVARNRSELRRFGRSIPRRPVR